ncbi:MAG: hypothetical protein JKY19_13895 [Alcanivoracaceae bacterium]|nr:hypothetical protein [Alcanivoracaceae bacterium]
MIDKNTNNFNRPEKKILHRAYCGLSKLLLQFNLDFDGFCKSLRETYVFEAYKTSHTVTRTSLKVSIDRRIVSAILNNKEQYQRPSSILTILNRIEVLAFQNDMIINKLGANSVESIIFEVAYGATTINSVINELVALDCIEDLGKEIRFIANQINNTTEDYRALQQFSNHLNQYINTFINNLNDKQHDKKNHQSHVYSTKIPAKAYLELQRETGELLSATHDKLKTLYSSYEQQVPEGTYKEMGVSLNQFNLNSTE